MLLTRLDQVSDKDNRNSVMRWNSQGTWIQSLRDLGMYNFNINLSILDNSINLILIIADYCVICISSLCEDVSSMFEQS